MNEPGMNELREALWRRPLTPEEQVRLDRWLEEHQGERADWEAERGLEARLERLPAVPVSTNFTARVLAAIDQEVTPRASGAGWRGAWWRLPRFAAGLGVLSVLVAVVGFQVHHQRVEFRREIAQSMAVAAGAVQVPGVAVLEDFDSIQRLGDATPVDEELFTTLTELASN